MVSSGPTSFPHAAILAALRHPACIALRTATAVGGGYGLASLIAVACSAWLPGPRVDAVLTGMLISFLVFAGAALWAYSARSAWGALLGIALPAAAVALPLWFGGHLA